MKNETLITVAGQQIGLLMTAYVYEQIDEQYEGGVVGFLADEGKNKNIMKRGYTLILAQANNYARKHPEQKVMTLDDIRDWPYNETFAAVQQAMNFFRGGDANKNN